MSCTVRVSSKAENDCLQEICNASNSVLVRMVPDRK